eukprot:3918235-Prymnesium_polylepis.1
MRLKLITPRTCRPQTCRAHTQRTHTSSQTRQLLAILSTDTGASEAECFDRATSRTQHYTPRTRLEGI